MRAGPVAPPSSPACPLPTGIKAVQGAAPVTLHHRAKGTRGPSWMSPEHQCVYGEPMLRGHCAAAGHRVGLGGGHKTPWGSGEPEARGQCQARLCPCANQPGSREGMGANCHPLPHSIVLPLGSPTAPPGPRPHFALCFWGGGLQAKGLSGCTPLPPPAQTHPSQDMRQLERWIWGLEVVQ